VLFLLNYFARAGTNAIINTSQASTIGMSAVPLLIIFFLLVFVFLAVTPSQLTQTLLAIIWVGLAATGAGAVLWELARRM
jgi:hypothetical protein